MLIKTNSRILAAFIHLCISLAVFSLFIFILLFYWYPAPFFSASGGWQGLRIVALIDVVLGPLLTLVLFSPKKPNKELITDLSLVAIMQIAALCWGIYTVYQQRPAAVVFLDYSFYTVPAQDLASNGIKLEELKKYGDNLPVYVYIDKPDTIEGLEKFRNDVLEHSLSPLHNLKYYSPITKHFDDIYQHNLDINEVMAANSEMKAEIMALMADKTDPEAALLEHHYIGLVSRYRNIILVFDKTNKIIGYASTPFSLNM